MKISLLAAVSDNDVIAKNGKIPWFVRGEQAIFKRLTMGHPIIMGRKTHQALGRTLAGRLNIVVSRNHRFMVSPGSILVDSLEGALKLPRVKLSDEVFIIGGQQLFEDALDMAGTIYLTKVHTHVDNGDRFFRFEPGDWKMVESQLYKSNEVPDRPYDFEFQVWHRR